MAEKWYEEHNADDVYFKIKIKEHLHSEKTPFQEVNFYDSETFGRFFTLDGYLMLTEYDEFGYHNMITHPAFAVHPKIETVLIIGGGDGGTAKEVLLYDTVKNVDMVEIDERVVRLCQKYIPNIASALDNDERLNLFFEDGVKFVADKEDNTYDLILVDSTDPIGPGEGLFTSEFYKNCHRILKEDGIMINQHESPFYPKDRHAMIRAHKRIRDTFKIANVYQFHAATYPSGMWLFGFASKKYCPINNFDPERWHKFNLRPKYYNTHIHLASFAMPTYVSDILNNIEK